MGVETALFVAAAAIQIYGQRQANEAQANAERLNAAQYAKQQEMAAMASRREADIYSSESQAVIGESVSFFDRAGIDIAGSALMTIANMKEQAGREYRAILIGAQQQSSLIGMKQQQAARNADMLSSGSYNNIQSLGTLLNVGTSYKKATANKSTG